MKIYTAASMNAKDIMKEWRAILKPHGITVNSRWLDFNEHIYYNKWEEMFAVAGLQDYEDVDKADVVIIFTDITSTSGGFYWEFGYAFKGGKEIFIVGKDKPKNVFFYINDPKIKHFKTFTEVALELVLRVEKHKTS